MHSSKNLKIHEPTSSLEQTLIVFRNKLIVINERGDIMLQVTQYIQPLPGWSMPHLVLCSDGNHYVIKLLSNPQGIKVLVNELICSQLAKRMNLLFLTARSFSYLKE